MIMSECKILLCLFFFFFFNDTATTEIYTLSLHDALPICMQMTDQALKILDLWAQRDATDSRIDLYRGQVYVVKRSEEHTSELQSQSNLVCRLLLEKKKKKN